MRQLSAGTLLGNSTMRARLQWPPEKYEQVKAELLAEGQIKKGVGRGGSVGRTELAADVPKQAGKREKKTTPRVRENQLYAPFVETIQASWKAEQELTNWWAADTHSKAKKGDDAGIWTRPDITGLSVTKFLWIPNNAVDLWTFEIKTSDAVNILGLLEAAAHQRFATRSYVAYHITQEQSESLDKDQSFKRITDEAVRLNIGVITFLDPAAFDTWEIINAADRHEPDPHTLDRAVDEFLRARKEAERREIAKLLRG